MVKESKSLQTFREFLTPRLNEIVDKKDADIIKKIFNKASTILKDENSFSLNEKDADSIILASLFLEAVLSQWDFFKLTQAGEVTVSDIDKISRKVVDRFLLFYETETKIKKDNLPFFDARVATLSSAERFLEKINKPLSHTNPSFSLINDIFETIFVKVAGFTRMLPLGLYADAFVAWRTLHESECIVKLLVNGGDKTRYSYIKHITYNNAYRNAASFSTEDLDAIFAKLKGEMKEHGLKSKDMKKFIEYGWLFEHPDYDSTDVTFKLNFRDGIEKLAGLNDYSKIYEGASEIAHSSSAFFYVNDNFCRDLSLVMVYRSFIRIMELYLTYMGRYFSIHPKEKEKALSHLDDVKLMSSYLDKQININEVMQNDD